MYIKLCKFVRYLWIPLKAQLKFILPPLLLQEITINWLLKAVLIYYTLFGGLEIQASKVKIGLLPEVSENSNIWGEYGIFIEDFDKIQFLQLG